MAEEAPRKLMGPWMTAFSLFKGFVCTGILYMPKNFINGGYAFSAGAMLFSLIFTLYCLKLLLDVRKKLGGTHSFSQLGQTCLGDTGRILVDITLVGSQVSFVTAYVYFISKNLQQIAVHAMGITINKWFFGLGCFIIYVPLVMVRKMDTLAMTHVFGDIMIFTVIVSLFIYGGLAIQENEGFSTENIEPLNTATWSNAIGFAVYAYEGIGVILPLQDITEDKDNYVKVLTYVLCFIFVLYIVFSEFSIFAFGHASIGNNPLITQSMPQTSPVVWVLEICFCINLVFSYPLMMHPANNVIESYLYRGWPKS